MTEQLERRDPARAAGRVKCARDVVLVPDVDEKGQPVIREVELVCRDDLAFHSPCSKCACPSFVEPPTEELVVELPARTSPDTPEAAHAPPRRRRRRD